MIIIRAHEFNCRGLLGSLNQSRVNITSVILPVEDFSPNFTDVLHHFLSARINVLFRHMRSVQWSIKTRLRH
jgi:hypothetical protein